MILYLIGLIILLVILFFMYIRIRYRFWALQPVFHFYDVYYWFVNVGIIRHKLPEKNKYINFQKIETLEYNKVSPKYLNDFTQLIRNNYLCNKDNTYSPKKENITPYFESHNSKTCWSFYWEPNVLVDNKTNELINDKKLIGVITNRPLHVEIINTSQNSKFDVNYIDLLCVDKHYRGKEIAPQLIQTHEYNQCHLNPKICVSLFKREEELTGIIPLTIYTTFCFNMDKWRQPNKLESKFNLLVGDKQNIYYLYNFIVKTKSKWDITILPEVGNIMELVSTKNIYVSMIILNGEIIAAYIFRKTKTYIEKNKCALSCICSIKGDISNEIFIKGFKNSLWNIKEKYAYLLMENLSDNDVLINNIIIKTKPMIQSPTAYFFYNFVYNTFQSNKVLMIN